MGGVRGDDIARTVVGFSASEHKLRLGVGGRDAKTQRALKIALDEEDEWED